MSTDNAPSGDIPVTDPSPDADAAENLPVMAEESPSEASMTTANPGEKAAIGAKVSSIPTKKIMPTRRRQGAPASSGGPGQESKASGSTAINDDGPPDEGKAGSVKASSADPAPAEGAPSKAVKQGEQQQASGFGGWGWLPSTASLQQAAAGALRDVRELTDSFQQALAVEDTDTETEDEAEHAARQRALAPAVGVPSPPDSNLEGRSAVLERLQGADHPLMAGLKVFDGHVEQLADGMAGLLGGILGGARSAGTQVVGRVEAGLEEFGRSTIRLLEGDLDVERVFALGGPAAAKTGSAAAPTGEIALDWAACFRQCGGQHVSEELEGLSNECARACNRLRAQLPPEACARMDRELTVIAALFELKAGKGPSEAAGKEQPLPDDASPLGKGHGVLESACSSGKERAAALPPGAGVDDVRAAAVEALAQLTALCLERLLALGRSIAAHFQTGRASDDGIEWPTPASESAALLQQQARRTLHCVEGLAAAYSAALAAAAAGGETAAEPPAQRAAAPLVAEAEEPTAPSTIKGKEGLEDWDASISKDSVQDDREHPAKSELPAQSAAERLKQVQDGWASAASAAVAQVRSAYRGLVYVVLLAAQDRKLLQLSSSIVI